MPPLTLVIPICAIAYADITHVKMLLLFLLINEQYANGSVIGNGVSPLFITGRLHWRRIAARWRAACSLTGEDPPAAINQSQALEEERMTNMGAIGARV